MDFSELFPRRFVAPAALVAFTALVPARALAEDAKTMARQLGQHGAAALATGEWQQADDDFRKADALFHAPTLMLGLARAESHEGRVVESWEHYRRIIKENVTSTPVFAAALHDAVAEIATVERRRSRLTICLTGVVEADAPRVTVDEAPLKPEALGVERFINAGHHRIAVSADGFNAVTRVVDLTEGNGEVVTIPLERVDRAIKPVVVEAHIAPSLPPLPVVAPPEVSEPVAPPPSPSHRRTYVIAAFTVGGAGLLLGAITGGVALSEHGTLSTACANGTCPKSSASELSTYHAMSTVSTIGFIVGGVGVAGGAVLLLTAPKPEKTSAQVRPYLGLGSVGAVGSF